MSMTSNELGKILRDMYNTAPRGEKVTMIHLFGVKYAKEIKNAGTKEVIDKSELASSYKTELSKSVKLSHYVNVK